MATNRGEGAQTPFRSLALLFVTMKSNKAKQPKPLTITLKGELAEEIRQIARKLGCMPSSAVVMHLRPGLLGSANTPEGRQFRLGTAAAYIGLSAAATAELHHYAVEREKAAVARRRAEREAAERKSRRQVA